MIKERAWPAKAMYILVAAALAMSLIIMAAPTQKASASPDELETEWDRVSTPSEEDWVIARWSSIIDYATAEAGDVAYAAVMKKPVDPPGRPNYCLLKSTDGAATWEDISDELAEMLDDEGITSYKLLKVATDGEDADFLTVAIETGGDVYVYISTDGGDTWEDEPGLVKDGVYELADDGVFDLAVSPEDDDEHDIAIGGTNWTDAMIFRCTVDGDSAGSWEDARYEGWDDSAAGNVTEFFSEAVTDIQFSPDWSNDNAVLVTTVTGSGPYEEVYLQSGSWGMTEGWNAEAGFPDAVCIIGDDEDIMVPLYGIEGYVAGITLPEDYSGEDSDTRYAWVWVNYRDYNPTTADIGTIFRVKNKSVVEVNQQIEGTPWLTNVSYWGTIDDGKAIAGVLGSGMSPRYGDPWTECCEGVQVYRNDGVSDMDICCIFWDEACKPPTGRWAMEAFYLDDDKAYGVSEGFVHGYDESAWSVSFDDGDSWNQLSLIDTNIDYLSDVAVSPDCNKTMLVSVHKVEIDYCGCDSVWVYAEDDPGFHEAGYSEYSGHWLRTWCGLLQGVNAEDFFDSMYPERGLLRLALDETTGETVYLLDRMTDTMYRNDMETLGCWDTVPSGPSEIDHIVDLAVKDKETIYVLEKSGYVAMLDEEDWHEAADSEIDAGWTIAVWGDHVLVGGQDGDWNYSADNGETWMEPEDAESPGDGYVTVAFDSYFDENDTVYAALAEIEDDDEAAGGVYRWIIGESEDWKDLEATPTEARLGLSDDDEEVPVAFTGLVLDRPGNLFTSADTGGVLYASYISAQVEAINATKEQVVVTSGVARYLTPAEDVVCKECGDWDYLIEGLTTYTYEDAYWDLSIFEQLFLMAPQALKICGCLSPDTNSKLFAIGVDMPAMEEHSGAGYDMEEGKFGTVWMFEDCYAKKGAEVIQPEDGEVIPADPCECWNIPFTISWNRLCDACVYDIEFALDEEFTSLVLDACEYDYIPSAGNAPAYQVPGVLVCEFTYYYRIRAIEAGTGQVIRSWWSVPRSVTIAPSIAAGEITLVAPVPGATGVPTKNVGFSWSLAADFDSFEWVLWKGGVEVDSATVTDTYHEHAGPLDYGATYSWQVEAYNEGALVSTSAVGTFTTAEQGAFCCPQCGLCFDTQAKLEAHIADAHPDQPTTPFWVWIVIAIGAVLVIVVIVLIFRTRRV
jgi:hypothetical protein